LLRAAHAILALASIYDKHIKMAEKKSLKDFNRRETFRVAYTTILHIVNLSNSCSLHHLVNCQRLPLCLNFFLQHALIYIRTISLVNPRAKNTFPRSTVSRTFVIVYARASTSCAKRRWGRFGICVFPHVIWHRFSVYGLPRYVPVNQSEEE